MKKILSLVLVTVMVMSLSIPAFADKPAWVGNNKAEKVEKELPKGLQDKAVIPYGHRKDQEVDVEDMEALIEKVEDYIDALDTDSDDDGIGDADDDDELSADIIDLEEAEEIALGGRDGSIVEMSFDGEDYEFVIWYADKEWEVEVDGVTGDRDVESEDLKYDLEGVMSYEDAKATAMDIIADEEDEDSDDIDGIFTEIELDIEDKDDDDDEDEDDDDDEDEDEDNEGAYTVEVRTATKTYEIEFDAIDGDLLAFESESNDDDYDQYTNRYQDRNSEPDATDDQDRDRDRVQDRDEEGDGMVSAIENLIDRIEYELEKDEPKLGHFMFQLEQKFHVLQKIYGEAPEKEDYTEDLEELKDKLDDIEDDPVFDEDNDEDRDYDEEIRDLIDEIQEDLDDLDDDEFIDEASYEAFEEAADEYFDMLDDAVESDELEDLVAEVRGFVLNNEFGSDVGEYSQEEALELLGLLFEYPSIDEEDLDDYYKDLKLSYKKFKMSKLVAGDYLETLLEYKADLDVLDDEDLTDDEISLKVSLVETIEGLNENGKVSLGTFYELEADALSLLGDTVEDPEDYEEALDEKIDEVREAIFTSYEDVDQDELRDEKMILLGHYFQGIDDQDNASTEAEFEEAYDELNEALIAFNDFLDQE
jgi:hypothetical protein